MERKFVFSFEENYHIYNRGIEKRKIFLSNTDYKRFVLLLNLSNNSKPFNVRDFKKTKNHKKETKDERDFLVDIGAWCLMPNHFHILLYEKTEGGISKFMSKLLTGYTMYFNKKYDRKGRLFESTFQAQHLDSDEYLKYIFSYIHLNPVKLIEPLWKKRGLQDSSKTSAFLEKYEYSSYLDYLGFDREEGLILSKENFPDYFPSEESFKENLLDWLKFDPQKP